MGAPKQGPVVVSRQRERAEADAFLKGLSDGPRTLVLEGEPGIGKTTLWRWVLAQARARGLTVLSCRAVPAEVMLSHVCLADLLTPVTDELLPSLPTPQRGALEVALLQAEPTDDVDARAIGVAVLSILTRCARTRPIVVAIDDVTWLDTATASALAFALRRTSDTRIGLCLTRRDSASAPAGPSAEHDLAVADNADGTTTRLRLGPLDARSLFELLLHRLGHPFPRPTLERIARTAHGNPLFALEIARALLDSGVLPEPGAALPVPETLGALVERRVQALSRSAREALLAAACTGDPTLALVEEVVGLEATAALDEAVDAGLITLQAGRIRFTHPVFATAVSQAATDAHRRAMHQRLARAAVAGEERARHAAFAVEGPDESAAALIEAAAHEARARGAPGVAGELVHWAARLTPPTQQKLVTTRLVRAAEHYDRAGDPQHARRLLEPLASEVEDTGLRTRILRLLGEIEYRQASFRKAILVLDRALASTGDAVARTEVLLDLAYAHFATGAVDAALGAARQARRHAEEVGPGPSLAESLAIEANVAFFTGAGLDHKTLGRALALEAPDRDVQLLVRPSAIAALFALYDGDFDLAIERLQRLRTAMAGRGEDTDSLLLTWLCWAHIWRGHLPQALAVADEALLLSTQAGSKPLIGAALMHRGKARAYLGEVDQARDDLQRSETILQDVDWSIVQAWGRSATGFLELSVGDPAAAVRAYEPLLTVLETSGVREPFAAYFVPDAAEALVALGQVDRARRLLDDYLARADELDRRLSSTCGLRARALLLCANGEMTAASRAIETSLEVAADVQAPFEVARCHLVHGLLLRRSRRKQAARDALETARDAFTRLGTSQWAQRAQHELARTGQHIRPGQLTVTEEQVARHAAAGRTNREIAALLFISPKTVEANLSRVYRKLDIRSRAELGRTMILREVTKP
jgi:ATP/maltotriose-dependent transcriptional regulator MalT